MSIYRMMSSMLAAAALTVACGGNAADPAGAPVEEQAAAWMPVESAAGIAPELAEGFASVYAPYEEIGRALSNDGSDAVAEAAGQLAAAARDLSDGFSAELAGVAEEEAPAVQELLPALAEAADAMAGAADLKAERAAFEEMSRLMVSYRDLLVGVSPLVAYCPMVDAHWLQSAEEISNPYYGSEMLRCGEIVRR